MRTQKYHLYVNYEDYKMIIESLVEKKNGLIATGHYTDFIDEILVQLSRAKIKKVKVR